MAVVNDTDLLKIPNKYFMVVFDIFTPRPHFVLLLKPGIEQDRTFQGLELDEKESLMDAVLQMSKDVSSSGILSFHLGTWASTKNKFHAHFCITKEVYIQVFKNSNVVMSKRCVTKEWKKSRDPVDYILNVRGYPYKSYHSDDVSQIQAWIESGQKSSGRLEAGLKWGKPPLSLVFHPKLPRIGFEFTGVPKPKIVTAQPSVFCGVLESANGFAEKIGMAPSRVVTKDASHGCHLCLLISEDSRGSGFPGDSSVVAYIEMAALKYYQLCPESMAQAWFKEFKQNTGYCPLT